MEGEVRRRGRLELDGEPHALACDRFDRIEDNIAAIAAHIETLRGQERWGVADMKQAFAGHVALPAPEQWWQVLGVAPNATPGEIDRQFVDASKLRRATGWEPGIGLDDGLRRTIAWYTEHPVARPVKQAA